MSQSARQQQQRQPAAESSAQGVVVFEGFSGLQTQPSRYGIGDQEAYIMDGFFPAGNSNARVIYDNSLPIYTAPAGRIITFFGFGNIGAVPFAIVFLDDGSIVSVNTDTGQSNVLAPPGTLFSSGGVAVSQWGSQFILIVANQPDGYFIIDTVQLYGPGDVIPGVPGPGPIASSTLLAGGSGYAVGDTGVVIGGINDATYTVNAVNATGDGSGYAVGDTGVVATGDGNATYIINTVDGLGAVTGMHITAPGTNYLTANDVPTATGGAQPGSGTGLTLNISVSSPPGPITGFTLTDSGVVTSYTLTATGTEYLPGSAGTITGGAQPGVGLNLTLDLVVSSATVPTGIGGNGIEVFQSRVWIIRGATLIWSAPGSFTDFSTADGGGSLISNDSSLRVRYTNLKQSNGYLYLFGDSSISYIAGVQTTGSPPTTSFSLQNVDPEVGTPWGNTVDVIGSNIVFANPWGGHVSFGGRAAKISAELDGIYNSLPNFGGGVPSAAKAIVFGKRVWVLLLPVIDSYTGQPINKLFLWDEKRWCSTQQSVNLFLIQNQEIDSVLTAWGSDGAVLCRLFQRPTTNLRKVIRSKFWSPSGGLFFNKAESRIAGLATIFSGPDVVVNVCIDSEHGSSCTDITLPAPQLIWYQDSLEPPAPGAVVLPWTGALGAPLIWTGTGNDVAVFPPTGDLANNGALVGLTISTFAADLALSSVQTIPSNVQGRF